jgi:hypothetical protein
MGEISQKIVEKGHKNAPWGTLTRHDTAGNGEHKERNIHPVAGNVAKDAE